MKLEIYKHDTWHGDDWRWRVVARNGKIVAASSEGFKTRYGAKRNLKATLRMLTKLVVEAV